MCPLDMLGTDAHTRHRACRNLPAVPSGSTVIQGRMPTSINHQGLNMDRITKLRIKNVRSFEDVEVTLSEGITVLTGIAGSGKSTILDSLRVLKNAIFERETKKTPSWELLREDQPWFEIEITVEGPDAGEPLTYRVRYDRMPHSLWCRLIEEEIRVGGVLKLLWQPAHRGLREQAVFICEEDGVDLCGVNNIRRHVGGSSLNRMREDHKVVVVNRVFDVIWGIRGTTLNHPSAVEFAWRQMMSTPTPWVDRAVAIASMALDGEIKLVDREPVLCRQGKPDLSLGLLSKSESMLLSLVGDVANYTSSPYGGYRKPTLLLVDDDVMPHDPSMKMRVTSMLQSAGGVLLATQDSAVMNFLHDPVDSFRVCLDGKVLGLDAGVLPGWLERFDNIGNIWDSGYMLRVLKYS